MKLKYLVVPDYVLSKNDKQWHWVGAADLIRLYKVDPRECFIFNPERRLYPDSLIELYPKYNGDYKVPER